MKKKYKPIDWGSPELEYGIMRNIPDEIISYYVCNYKHKGIPLAIETVMEIKNILQNKNQNKMIASHN